MSWCRKTTCCARSTPSSIYPTYTSTWRRTTVSPTDPQARWTAAPGGPAFYAYSTNYAGIIIDVEATPAHRSLEVQSTKTMIERVEERMALRRSG